MKFIWAISAFFLCAGCVSAELPEPDENFIKCQWAKSIRNLGLNPIYPPTGDILVGDVFQVAEPAFNERNTDPCRSYPAVRADHIDVRDWLKRASGFQINIPTTPDESGKKDLLPIGTSDGANLYDQTVDGRYLQAFALPEYTIARGRSFDFTASIPLRFFPAIFGAGQQSEVSVTVKIPTGETHGLYGFDALRLLYAYCQPVTGDEAFRNSQSSWPSTVPRCDHTIATELILRARGKRAKGCTRAYMVTRLYYARHIEYTYTFEDASAISASVVSRIDRLKNRSTELSALLSARPTTSTPEPDPDNPDDNKPAPVEKAQLRDQLAERLAADIDAELRALASSAVPGGSLSVSSYAGNQITLSQTFKKPVAFGYRAMTQPNHGATCIDGAGPVGDTVIEPLIGEPNVF